MPAGTGARFLREMLVCDAAAVISDVPATGFILSDLDAVGLRGHLLIERVRDHLAQRVLNTPVLQDLLDIEVELVHIANLYKSPRALRPPMTLESGSANLQ